MNKKEREDAEELINIPITEENVDEPIEACFPGKPELPTPGEEK